MSALFNHYLITRFNLRTANWKVTKNNETLLTEEWMNHRLWLFENFCLPSVIAQVNKNFSWLIYFDATTTDKYKEQINKLAAAYDFIRIFYINGMESFFPAVELFVAESNKPFVITSRIDNDDCLHKNYIQAVQDKFDNQDFCAIDVVKGYSLQIEPAVMLGKKEHLFNPFISLIEKNKEPKTVWMYSHTSWKNETKIVQVKEERLWLSIIHNRNKVNKFDGYGDVQWSDITKDFCVSPEVSAWVAGKLLPYKSWYLLGLSNMLRTRYVLASKGVKKILGIYKLKRLLKSR